MADLSYKHFFKVENGNIVFEDKEMLDYEKRRLEGKRGYATLHEDEEKASTNQFRYYFGVVIRKYCLQSECFVGMSEYQVHEYFLMELRSQAASVLKKNGQLRTIVIPGNFDKMRNSKKKFKEYIEEVIALLNTEFEIYPLPAEYFTHPKYNME